MTEQWLSRSWRVVVVAGLTLAVGGAWPHDSQARRLTGSHDVLSQLALPWASEAPPVAVSATGSEAAAPCGAGGLPPGTAFPFPSWPPSCWRPFSDLSAFNLPVPSDVPTPTAAQCGTVNPGSPCPEAGYVPPAPGNLLFDPNGWTGMPTYYVDSQNSTTSYAITCTGDGGNGACDQPSSPRIPLPNGAVLPIQYGDAQYAGTSTSVCTSPGGASDPPGDCHVTVIDTSTGIEHDLFATHTANGTLPVQASTSVIAGGSGHESIVGDGRAAGAGNAVAAGTAALAGRIRLEEFEAAVAYEDGQGGRPLGHVLAIRVPCISSLAATGVSRYPATAPDAGAHKCSGSGPLMGSRIRLHPTASQVAALPGWQRAIVRAATTYGMIVTDISGAGSPVSFEFESGNQYAAAGQTPSSWYTYATQTLGMPVGSPPCSGWTGLADPNDPSDTKDCPAVGHLDTAAFAAVWSTAAVVPECASFPGSNPSACPEIKSPPGLSISNSKPTPGSTITVTGTNYPAGAPMLVCEAPVGATQTCPAGAPTSTVQVDWNGAFSTTLTVNASVAGVDCTQSGQCKVYAPDLIWGRPTGRPEASSLVTVQAQSVPTAIEPPRISGNTVVGQVLHERHGVWSYGPIIHYAYRWERCNANAKHCSVIAKATKASYRVQTADVGDRIRVVERAANSLGWGQPAMSVATQKVRPRPRVSRLSVAPRKFRAAGANPSSGLAVGTTIRFKLNVRATMRFTVARALAGRMSHGRCQAPSRGNRSGRSCVRLVAVAGSFTVKGKAGRNSVRFNGRLKMKTLTRGDYVLRATAQVNGASGPTLSIKFTILP